MPITIESIYKPLNDFFLSKLGTASGSPVFFRFDKFGSVVSDEDFVDPSHPERGYVPAIANEKFSELVDCMPVDQNDGVNIVLSTNAISETYFLRLLNPAQPHLPPGATDKANEAVTSAFGTMKAYAVKVYNQTWVDSTQGMREVWPNNPLPSDWYDKTKHDSWAPYSVTVAESTTAPAPGPPPQIFRLKLSDESVRTVLQLAPSGAPAAGTLATKALSVATAAKPVVAAVAHPAAGPVRVMAMAAPIAVAANLAPAATVSSAVLHAQLMQEVAGLSVKNRVAVGQLVASVAPTQPATTKSISIAFEWCKVDIKRPWYIDAFISDKSWCVPAVAKGELSSESPGMSLLPISLVAVRNLAITASWTSEDLASAKVSDGFGPFKVTFDSQTAALSHPGVQVVGWVVQKLPVLPPNDPQ